jgi:hypothetical protein
VCRQMDVIPRHALLEHVDGNFLHVQNDVVDLPALLGELAVYGECPGLS